MNRKILFTKMHGLGNDYIYINTDLYPIADPAAFSIKWSRQHTGIGSDGLILISRSDVADFRMRIFNADGTEAMMCGNGSRCVGKYVYDKGLTDKTVITLETLAGIKVIRLHVTDSGDAGARGVATSATVDMGEPSVYGGDTASQDASVGFGGLIDYGKWDSLPLQGTFVSMGNPHYVVFLDHVATDEEVTLLGRGIEFAAAFPQRCNIEFACPQSDGTIRMRVWERGSGITQACGTGACATAVAACVTGHAGRTAEIVMDGGILNIEWCETDNHIYMTGPAETAFEGSIALSENY